MSDGYLTLFKKKLADKNFWPTEEEQFHSARDEALELYAVDPRWRLWSAARTALATEQLTYTWLGIDSGPIDGLLGPQTLFARQAYDQRKGDKTEPSEFETSRDQPETDLPKFKSPFPREQDMIAFYGKPGPQIQAALVRVKCPWELKLAWDTSTTTTSVSIHSKCANSLQAVFNDLITHYSQTDIVRLGLDLYGGSYAHRKKRGGSSWSTHAFGAAIDWDPLHNGLHVKAPGARLSHADYQPWWEVWEAHGWLSLGRTRDFDWMHVQAAKL